MPVYIYRGILDTGEEIKGEIAAENPDAARNELAEKGMFVKKTAIKQKKTFFFGAGRVGAEEILFFAKELAALIKAGLTVPEAVSLTCRRPGSRTMEHILKRVNTDIRKGVHLSAACAAHTNVFDSLFISALKTGEMTGCLAAPLEKYAVFLEKKTALAKKVSQAAAYPIFLLIIMALIITVLFSYVMPRFAVLYAGFDAELPGFTGFLFHIADNFFVYAGSAAVFFIVMSVVGVKIKDKKFFREFFDRLKINNPLTGQTAVFLEYERTARTMAMLLSGGTPLVDAMEAAKDSVKNSIFAQRLDRVITRVKGGDQFSEAARSEKLFSETAAGLLNTGEASGSLENMLSETAAYYERRIDYRMSRIMSLVEPAMILAAGVLVGAVVVMMYLPVFKIAEIIR
ncbi:MAG: type II secretion system F family protein [Candidatus Goldiibacteriota bacterium]